MKHKVPLFLFFQQYFSVFPVCGAGVSMSIILSVFRPSVFFLIDAFAVYVGLKDADFIDIFRIYIQDVFA